MFNEKLLRPLLFLRDIIAAHVMEVYPEDSVVIPVLTRYPHEVRGAFAIRGLGFLVLLSAPKWMRVGM